MNIAKKKIQEFVKSNLQDPFLCHCVGNFILPDDHFFLENLHGVQLRGNQMKFYYELNFLLPIANSSTLDKFPDMNNSLEYLGIFLTM